MKKELPLPDVCTLRQALRYDRATGKLYWKARPQDHFPTYKAFRQRNAKFAGKEAFTATDNGYKVGAIFGVRYKAHRVIWKLVKGEEPPPVIDHKNRVRSYNRISNLREATHTQNHANRVKVKNRSGFIGIRLSNAGNWEARIIKCGRYFHLGTFDTKEKAVATRKKFAREIHGEFAT